ncbi:molybdopterin-guanine dinucleotide biosynthesis protein B [Sporomusa sphaeroides]|uniref:molybdopterin-guanine dinucleotide biosynthesis protein B n=1 Tax=Sporomusa sphaeroides TaxID=47679 RepID=UPI002B83C179|nr:molybdopterin-guanine dinucleotide biosynthesis protein B [Sporomusa sphaeroides]HML32004.1 molybdopterin-guanine dinucleotide biosynthesis protein B [Sporomusa sphaeroides]
MIPVVSFIGYGNSGKTTFLIKVISEMKNRGYKVAIVKHDVHGFDIDKPGKDTWRYAQAGADTVCISSPAKMALIRQVDEEMSLDAVLRHIEDVDIIFTEGFKQESKPKIEVYRKASGQEPIGKKEDLVAVVSDTPLYDGIPCFSLEDEVSLADFVIQHFRIKRRGI